MPVAIIANSREEIARDANGKSHASQNYGKQAKAEH